MFTYEVFDALSHPRRRTILRLLTESDLDVSALCERFEISRPAVSRHLRILREAGLVSQRRHGRQRIYRLEPVSLQDAADWLYEVASRRILARERVAEEVAPRSEERRERTVDGPDWKQW